MYLFIAVVIASGRFLPDVLEEISLLSFLVKEVKPFVDNTLEALAADGFRLLSHGFVVLPFTLIFRFGIDVDAKRLVTDGLHGFFVTEPG